MKFNLFAIKENKRLEPFLKGIVEEIGNTETSSVSFTSNEGKKELKKPVINHREALLLIFDEFGSYNISKDEICSIGHRVVHGGDKLKNSIRIDEAVIDTIEGLIPIAPLHNPPNLTGIIEAIKLLPEVPQVAVFDTAFHSTIPEYAFRYAIPEKWFSEYGVRKYGFHGISHMYVSKRAARFLHVPYSEFNCITVHLGNGCSITKIENGKSTDTSMGFTPLQGLVMGTRSGDIDAALIPHTAERIMKEEGVAKQEAYDKVFGALNKGSGLKALSGTNMMQVVRERALQGEEQASMALDVYAYRIANYIGSYWAAMRTNHAVVFTAGVGENEGYVRKKILGYLKQFNITVNDEKNAVRKQEVEIGAGAGTSVLVIPTDEEIVIGYDALYLGYLGQVLPEIYPFEAD